MALPFCGTFPSNPGLKGPASVQAEILPALNGRSISQMMNIVKPVNNGHLNRNQLHFHDRPWKSGPFPTQADDQIQEGTGGECQNFRGDPNPPPHAIRYLRHPKIFPSDTAQGAAGTGQAQAPRRQVGWNARPCCNRPVWVPARSRQSPASCVPLPRQWRSPPGQRLYRRCAPAPPRWFQRERPNDGISARWDWEQGLFSRFPVAGEA